MTLIGWTQILLFCALVAALARPLGGWMTRLLDGDVRVLAPIERPIWRLAGTSPDEEQSWLGYALALLAFNLAGFLALYALQRLQGELPLNPAGMPAVPPALAFNTAVSFMTNTNWQNYGGETTMSHTTQMAGLTVQNFVSAATGIAVAVAVIRGFARASARSVGNF
jgi:K+-transporting ATPase ATPase A chain